MPPSPSVHASGLRYRIARPGERHAGWIAGFGGPPTCRHPRGRRGRLQPADEAGTARMLRDHRAAADPLVAEHGGRIVKTTGDGVLVEFSSVVGAVRCAVALQKLMAERNAGVSVERRMDWRIGVHLGDILIDGDDILGDGVNLAAP